MGAYAKRCGPIKDEFPEGDGYGPLVAGFDLPVDVGGGSGAVDRAVRGTGKGVFRGRSRHLRHRHHRIPLARGDSITGSVNGQCASGSFPSIDFLETAKQGRYATVDADLSYTMPDRRLTVTGYVRNITKQGVLTQGFRYPFANPATNPAIDELGLILAAIRPPKAYGLRARYEF